MLNLSLGQVLDCLLYVEDSEITWSSFCWHLELIYVESFKNEIKFNIYVGAHITEAIMI